MIKFIKWRARFRVNGSIILLLVSVFFLISGTAYAVTQTNSQSLDVTATVPGPPPTSRAVITSPTNNSTYSVTPIVISGSCGPGLIVKVFINSQLAGSTSCSIDGFFSINTTLNVGRNELTALNYDTLDQAGPTSDTVVVFVSSINGSTPVSSSGKPKTKTPNQNTTNNEGTPDQINEGGGNVPIREPQESKEIEQTYIKISALLFDLILLIYLMLALLIRRHRHKKKSKQ